MGYGEATGIVRVNIVIQNAFDERKKRCDSWVHSRLSVRYCSALVAKLIAVAKHSDDFVFVNQSIAFVTLVERYEIIIVFMTFV